MFPFELSCLGAKSVSMLALCNYERVTQSLEKTKGKEINWSVGLIFTLQFDGSYFLLLPTLWSDRLCLASFFLFLPQMVAQMAMELYLAKGQVTSSLIK